MSGLQRIAWRRLLVRSKLGLTPLGLSGLVVTSEFVLILIVAVLSGLTYHAISYGTEGPIRSYMTVGILTALFYMLPFIGHGDYSIDRLISGRTRLARIFMKWNVAFLLISVVGFLTKTSAVFSRGSIVLFYVAGLGTLMLARGITRQIVHTGLRSGQIAPRRILLIGTDQEIAQFWTRRGSDRLTNRVVATSELPTSTSDVSFDDVKLRDSLAEAVRSARMFDAEMVLILSRGIDQDLLERVVDDLSQLPVSIHLDSGPVMDGAPNFRIETIGRISALTLAERPLGAVQAMAKRSFDVVAAGLGLLALAPVFLIIALLIKLDSRGPVIFKQRRRGYNHREFRICKFRTMSTMDDGNVVQQATQNDPRITRVGAILRRFNLDELPQLWNVLWGDMSIVGPRPHAVAHDVLFERRIERYARRLNVRPGITGWAQINGHRGETDTDDKMQARVEHDLHYIDNWSLALDLYIIAMTIVSPRAFSNAR